MLVHCSEQASLNCLFPLGLLGFVIGGGLTMHMDTYKSRVKEKPLICIARVCTLCMQ